MRPIRASLSLTQAIQGNVRYAASLLTDKSALLKKASRQWLGVPALSCQGRRGLRDRGAHERIDHAGMDGEDADAR